jgi:hypothetical protein
MRPIYVLVLVLNVADCAMNCTRMGAYLNCTSY